MGTEGTREREPRLPRPWAAPLRGYPADSSDRDIATVRRMVATGALLGRRRGSVLGLAQTVACKQQDLGVFDEAVYDGSGNSGVEEDVAPVGECSIGRDQCRSFLAVPVRNDLVEQIGCLLI